MALLARSAGSLGSVQASRPSMRSRGTACVVRATSGEQFWVARRLVVSGYSPQALHWCMRRAYQRNGYVGRSSVSA